MKTVKFNTSDPRLTLFANSYSFLVGTDSQHIDTSMQISFAGNTIKAGTVFGSLGQNIMLKGSRFLQAQDGFYYKVAGFIENVAVPNEDEVVRLVLFYAFSADGPVELTEFAEEHNVRDVYFALTVNPDEKTLAFTNYENEVLHYTDISVFDNEGPFVIIND